MPRLPTLPRWESESVPTSDSMWSLRSLAQFPTHYYETYVRKNVAESIVASDSDAWRAVTPHSTAASCRLNTTNGRDGRTPLSFQNYCGTWTCRNCATQRAVFHVGHLHRLMSGHPTIWLARLPDGTNVREVRKPFERAFDLDRLLDTLNDPQGRSFVRPWYAKIQRDDSGLTYLYASGEPKGALQKHGSFVDGIDAFDHARRVGLRLPGILRAPSYSANARPQEPSSSRSSIVVSAPNLSPRQQTLYRSNLEALARSDFGASVEGLIERSGLDFDAVSKRAADLARRGVDLG